VVRRDPGVYKYVAFILCTGLSEVVVDKAAQKRGSLSLSLGAISNIEDRDDALVMLIRTKAIEMLPPGSAALLRSSEISSSFERLSRF